MEPIIQDGYSIDPETGEVLEYVGEFEVNSPETFEWVMEKMQAEHAEIAKIQARKKSIIDNLSAMERTHAQRIQSLEFRFKNELANYAKENLPKGKKTYICPFGAVSFRTSQARLAVDNEQECIISAEDYGWTDAVKVSKSLLISKIPDDAVTELMGNPLKAAGLGFIVKPAEETVKIDTGVK